MFPNVFLGGEETLGEEPSQTKFLCDELKIANNIFFYVFYLIFSTLDIIPIFVSKDKNKIIFLYIRR